MASGREDLTDHEGTLLGLIVRAGPMTAYQVARVYRDSPVSNFNTSKGKLYPLLRRLRDRGLVAATPVAGDARGTETLAATEAGREAAKRWAMELRSGHLLLEDPLRTKVQSFELLSAAERRAWCKAARAMLEEKLAALHAYRDAVEVPFHDLVHDGAVRAVRARIEWLDAIEAALAKPGA